MQIRISTHDHINRDFGACNSKKIACFDLDGTLINVKSGSQFAKDATDWRLFNKNVPTVLKKFHSEGYKIAIFTNQGGIKSALGGKTAETVRGKVSAFLDHIGVPAIVFAATKKDEEFRKPKPGMWNLLVRSHNGDIAPDLSQCFYAGDAAGRDGDFIDTDTGKPARADIDFAVNAGLPFKTPEELFGEQEGKKKLVGGTIKDVDVTHGPNAELLAIFKELSTYYRNCGRENAHFKANAYNKVCLNLSGFQSKISMANLKEVGKIEGVGKGSLGIIKEYVETGKVQDYENVKAEQEGGAGSSAAAPRVVVPQSEAAKVASKFM